MSPNGYVVWQGRSRIDRSPIVLIVTGTQKASTNPKTGFMVQSWILRSDRHPMDAIHTGADEGICGHCSLRGQKGPEGGFGVRRTCYVNMAGVGQVYNTYRDGKYPLLDNLQRISGRPFRMGAYGDPAAVPYSVWKRLFKAIDPTFGKRNPRLPSEGVVRTGYTQRWREQPHLKSLCMASVQSPTARTEANDLGWRTYRIKRADQPVLPGEIVCPASKERNYSTLCLQCGLCGGSSITGPDIVIDVHGVRAQYF